MTVTDFVNRAIRTYPSLHWTGNYASSKFNVLHHAFIVLGNGLDWANTKDPRKGGYLVEPTYRGGRRVRDLPYKHYLEPALDPRFMAERLWRVIGVSGTPRVYQVVDQATVTARYLFESELELVRQVSTADDIVPGAVIWVARHAGREVIVLGGGHTLVRATPYPNFNRAYSKFWEINPKLIQPDWRHAAICHLAYWLDYFELHASRSTKASNQVKFLRDTLQRLGAKTERVRSLQPGRVH